MGQAILKALLAELEANPGRVLDLVEMVITLLRANPDLVKALIGLIPKPQA